MLVFFWRELEQKAVIKSAVSSLWLRWTWRILLVQMQRVQRGEILKIRMLNIRHGECIFFDYHSIILVVILSQNFESYFRWVCSVFRFFQGLCDLGRKELSQSFKSIIIIFLENVFVHLTGCCCLNKEELLSLIFRCQLNVSFYDLHLLLLKNIVTHVAANQYGDYHQFEKFHKLELIDFAS